MLIPDLSASVDGAHLVLVRRDGEQHSTFPIADLDAVEHLDLLTAGAALAVRAWSTGDLDAALAREGWRRSSPWSTNDPRVAAVVPTYLH